MYVNVEVVREPTLVLFHALWGDSLAGLKMRAVLACNGTLMESSLSESNSDK